MHPPNAQPRLILSKSSAAFDITATSVVDVTDHATASKPHADKFRDPSVPATSHRLRATYAFAKGLHTTLHYPQEFHVALHGRPFVDSSGWYSRPRSLAMMARPPLSPLWWTTLPVNHNLFVTIPAASTMWVTRSCAVNAISCQYVSWTHSWAVLPKTLLPLRPSPTTVPRHRRVTPPFGLPPRRMTLRPLHSNPTNPVLLPLHKVPKPFSIAVPHGTLSPTPLGCAVFAPVTRL